ncbi:hypothetical protein NQ042_13730, partial [Corynebacterium phoceense]|uniref:hypothetical protein n=1 Tax=Corynebacterium phoceense TaxID=1686286 RepID=UPI00211CE8B3
EHTTNNNQPPHKQETDHCRREQQNTKEQKKLHNTTNQPHKMQSNGSLCDARVHYTVLTQHPNQPTTSITRHYLLP